MRGLPSGYTELEYIESSGSQYINTDFMPDNNTRVIVDAEAVGSASSSHFLFGCRTSGTSESFCFFYYNNWGADFQTSANRKTFSDITFTDRLFVDFNGNVLTVNDTLVSFTETTFQTIVPLQLFAVNTNGTIGSMLAAKMYSCRIYDNGILARDFVPATDGSGTAGMYDLVTSVFYTNAGSGAFTAGPEITFGQGITKLNAAPFILNAGKARLASGICEITEGITLISGVLKKFVFKSAGPDVEGMAITCTGAYTDQIVTMSGMAYRLLTFTSSGTLKVPEAIKADVWMVGGGAGGKHGGGGTGFGGCGGYSLFAEGIILNANESVAIVVGSGGAGGTRKKDEDGYWEYTTGTGGKSSFGEYSTGSANNTSGGSGGGSAKNSTTILTGDGLSKYPFEDSGYFTDPLSGGGGGGAHHSGGSGYSYAGGAGGANGGNGNLATQSSWNSDSTQSGGSGGNKGGGTGAQATSVSAGSASAATYYGGGGGGGAYCQKKTSSNVSSAGAAGYQGIVYVRIPLEQ